MVIVALSYERASPAHRAHRREAEADTQRLTLRGGDTIECERCTYAPRTSVPRGSRHGARDVAAPRSPRARAAPARLDDACDVCEDE